MADSSNSKKEQTPAEPAAPMAFTEFLESCPPNQEVAIQDISRSILFGTSYRPGLNTPELQLYCTDDACNGMRFFRCTTSAISLSDGSWKFVYLTYKCSNCQKTVKTFSLGAVKGEDVESGRAFKFGELPSYGPPTPARLIKLIGPDRDLFLKGHRCENQGLGIGAFVYYRRVVENQKNRILAEILKVAKKLTGEAQVIAELEAAIRESQFTKALDGIKHGIPQTLLINGHNPLVLLHAALSEGVHGKTDQECLELATSARVVLVELSDRLSQALKDEAELNTALSHLLAIKGNVP